jgi:hypothetical protein
MTKPIRILSLGAGVQSTTLLLMMIEGEIERADHVIFADTGWEPKRVYEHLEYLRGLMQENDMPFHIVSEGNIREDFLNGDRRFASMPLHVRSQDGKKGMVRRQCTSEYKIKPLLKKQRELAGLLPGQRCKEHRVTTIIGISLDEVQRMRDPAFSWIENEYPLIDKRITRSDCLKWCEDRSYPLPPRSACIGCPFKSANEWAALRQDSEEWADAVHFDQAIRQNVRIRTRFNGEAYLHPSLKPLDEADLRTDQEKGIFSLFDQECEGMCGL